MAKYTREEVITKIRNNDIIFWGDDLRGLNLSGVDFEGCDLIGADLRDANLSGAILWRASTMGIKLGGANLQGADLRWSSLVDADLRNTDLRGANMEQCSFDGADLRGAHLEGANVEGITVDANTKLPEDANFLNAMSTSQSPLGPRSMGGAGKRGWGPNDNSRPGGGSGCSSIVAGSLTMSLILVSLLALLAFH